uniref:Probable magnesium transporter n=1 Tax=Aegilops tauschii subsp. strangulata TaxID=200361 RepID=A0A453F953_AEGTS
HTQKALGKPPGAGSDRGCGSRWRSRWPAPPATASARSSRRRAPTSSLPSPSSSRSYGATRSTGSGSAASSSTCAAPPSCSPRSRRRRCVACFPTPLCFSSRPMADAAFVFSHQVSVVQPIAGCGLAILCVFSHFYLKEVMNGLDWIAITMAGLGTIGVGVGGEEQKVEEIPLFSIPWLVLTVVILFVLLNTWLHIYKKQRREQELTGPEVIEEVIYGLESGILFGISSVISKMGFVMSEMGFPKIVVPAAISCSVACSAVGFVYQTRGLKHGRAIVVSTCTSVASIVSGVVAGMVALDEHLPTAPAGRFFLLLGWFFIITGVILLVTSTGVIARLPKPVQKFLKSNMERSHSIRRPGSARGKDSNQSTTIHASTLHILTSTGKEKA